LRIKIKARKRRVAEDTTIIFVRLKLICLFIYLNILRLHIIRIHVERTNRLYNSIGELNADTYTINVEHILLFYFIKPNIKHRTTRKHNIR